MEMGYVVSNEREFCVLRTSNKRTNQLLLTDLDEETITIMWDVDLHTLVVFLVEYMYQ